MDPKAVGVPFMVIVAGVYFTALVGVNVGAPSGNVKVGVDRE